MQCMRDAGPRAARCDFSRATAGRLGLRGLPVGPARMCQRARHGLAECCPKANLKEDQGRLRLTRIIRPSIVPLGP